MRSAVCLLTDEYPPVPGGVGQSVARIARSLSTDYDVTVLVLERSFQTPPFASHRDGPVEVVHVHPTEEIPDQRTARDTETFQRLLRLARERKFALYHSFFPVTTGLFAGLLAGLFQRPLIASFRGNDFHHGVFSRHLLTVQWIFERTSVATFVNREMASLAAVVDRRIAERSRVIWNGVVIPPERPARQTFHSPPVIGSSGAFRAKKGIRTLLEACRELANRIDFRLLLVGDFIPEEREHWRALLRRLELEPRIEFTGFVPHTEACRLLETMDVFVYPSLYDGCPNSLLEAAAAGKPIICSRIPALEDLVTDGRSCLMHEPENAHDLASRLELLLAGSAGRDLATQLGAEARRRACEQFSLEREANAWRTIYEDLLGPARGLVIVRKFP